MDELQGTRTLRPITPSTALGVPSLHQLTSIASVTVVHAAPHQAPLASHEAIRREQHEAEAMHRLSAEYLTLATVAQAGRWDALLARSGLSDAELDSVAASAARGPLFAGLRDADARGLNVDAALPKLVAGRSLADAADVASVLHSRVDRWSQAAGSRRRPTGHLIAGSFRESKV